MTYHSWFKALRSQVEAAQIEKGDYEKQIASYHTGVQSAVNEYQKRLAETAAALSQLRADLEAERGECQVSLSWTERYADERFSGYWMRNIVTELRDIHRDQEKVCKPSMFS